MVEGRGRCGEYGREIGRRAHFQVGLFETLLVALSIPWVNDQSVGASWVGERGLLVGEITPCDAAVFFHVHPFVTQWPHNSSFLSML